MELFHPEWKKDGRSRWYAPVRRLIAFRKTAKAELLLNDPCVQVIVHYTPEHTVLKPGGYLIADFGEALHGGVRITCCDEAAEIRLSLGESVSETLGPANQDHSRRSETLQIPKFGSLEYGNTVFRFVRIENTGTTEAHLQGFCAVALEWDLPVIGAFESPDERLNRIWKTAVRTVHLCMQDYIYDGAKRDRLVWMGDMHPEIRGILCAFEGAPLIRESLEFMLENTPEGAPMNRIDTYNCWFIPALRDYYMATGDLAFLKKHRGRIRSMLNRYAGYAGADGAAHLPGRRFLDWPNEEYPEARDAGIHALLFRMLRDGEFLLNELGLSVRNVHAAVERLASHPAPDPGDRKAPAALLTLTGLADRRDVLEHDPFRGVSTFFGYYVLQAKEMRPALDLIRTYWGAMLDLGATSFWEDFDLDWLKHRVTKLDELPRRGWKDIHADFGNYCYKGLRHSLSHGWSCGPAPFLAERVLGVQILAPGCREIAVAPDLGGLEYVKGAYPTPYGPVEIEAESSGRVKVRAPRGVKVIRPGKRT